MSLRDADDLLAFAARIAAEAGEITRARFGRVATEWKGDGSEVTEADRAAELHLRAAIADAYPTDGIVGEEGVDVPGTSGRRWVVDPIDGTRSFATGVPLYGTLIALQQADEWVLGCCHLPELRQTLVAARGAGAWLDGRRARVSECDRLAEARTVTSGLEYWWKYGTPDSRAGWDRLVSECRWSRTWGDAFGYLLVATGRAELLVDPAPGSVWDYAPMIPILAEAGGCFSAWGGGAVAADAPCIASNARLHEVATGRLLGG